MKRSNNSQTCQTDDNEPLNKKQSTISQKLDDNNNNKQMKPTITRVFYDDHLYGYERRRLTAIAYTHDRINNKVYYAAALFKEDEDYEYEDRFGSKKALKKALRTTALNRLEKKSICIDMPFDIDLVEMHKNIRTALYKYGAFQKTHNSY